MERCNWLKEMLKPSDCNFGIVLFRWNSRENDQIGQTTSLAASRLSLRLRRNSSLREGSASGVSLAQLECFFCTVLNNIASANDANKLIHIIDDGNKILHLS